ncbi:probable cyclopropane-fatty-acyl-phospholipid synthase UfaA1 (cyclopropane fatty acid synthase) (CFA synthase) [Janibacter sp. HTCC2649]|uniref:SAM-dependent methyltransferase n=1 Tax=Janibacter sp. HTCC2649 TaxID=313589 RepID=UPI000067195C|nr:cyclopropane-fatty-acyl-phospholipid synthase family protein [Janibacter sp. HTCC2649]EAP98502.1 probable cyclopropane-fatty-acyl-phospholipid synthase UfaA1 (cyclopropane fatty acid synthase) (CFA synthase) [Janibacter sp. HTCC2649]
MTSEVLPSFEIPTAKTLFTRGAVARTLIHKIVAGVPVRLRYPDGSQVGGGVEDGPTLDIVRPASMYRRIEQHPKIGLGEAYMAGDWHAAPGTDLAQALLPFAAKMGQLLPKPLLALRRIADRALPAGTRNTLTGSRANIEAHYDLSNDLFAAFLDPTMSYSSALFDHTKPLAGQDLVEAQHRKIDAMLDSTAVGPGSRVLEIGTGWGELALRAAARGADVLSITLSHEQRALAQERIAAAGLSDRVEVRLQDYREVSGEFDAIVSVEMIEAVGEEYWPTYFGAIDSLLAPGGTAAVQAILMDHDRFLATRNSYGWIQKYIFPGGIIPSLDAISEVTGRHTGLKVRDVRAFGGDYAETLRRWRFQFLEAWPTIEGGAFDETFKRMWEFYLAYCEAGFASGYLDVAQVTLRRD